ncbi:MAG: hypothetical protein PHQ43_14935 [Dehalococcoidales bacterium]|nr:hypothetical protein [Dehalococcoidales bacterium]
MGEQPSIVCSEYEGNLDREGEAFLEYARMRILNSPNTRVEFCKYMITVSTGAVPIYLGLFSFVVTRKSTHLSGCQFALAITPACLFLLSAIVFVLGYLPRSGHTDFGSIAVIREEYRNDLARRRYLINIATAVFFTAGLLAILVVVFNVP